MPMSREVRLRSRTGRRRAGRQGGILITRYRLGHVFPLLLLPCAALLCFKVQVIKYKQRATPDLAKKVTGPKGQDIDPKKEVFKKAVDKALRKGVNPQDLTDSAEKHWDKVFLYDLCKPAGCACPKNKIVMGQPEDTTHVVQISVDLPTGAGGTKTYTVDFEIEVTRKLGFANCK